MALVVVGCPLGAAELLELDGVAVGPLLDARAAPARLAEAVVAGPFLDGGDASEVLAEGGAAAGVVWA